MNSHQETDHGAVVRCPGCNLGGESVRTTTLRALLKEEAQQRITRSRYLFCDAAGCDTVYYAEDGPHTFERSDMTVRVGVKEREAPRPLCYCFGYSLEDIENEVRRSGQSTVLDDIKTLMKAGCSCETKSPQGACCLGTVRRLTEQSIATIGGEATPRAGHHGHSATLSGGPEPESALATVGGFGHLNLTGSAEKLTRGGAILAGVLASACCWLPPLLIALGVSGVAVSASLERHRPLFLTCTFALLGAAFYFNYRPKTTPSDGGEEGKSCCASAGNKTANIRRFNRIMLWFVTAVALGFALFPNYAGLLLGGGNVASAGEQLPADAVAVSIAVEGMTCEACAGHIRIALEGLPRARSATVSFASNSARVVVDRDHVDLEAIRKAIESAGYKVRRIEQENE